MDDIKNYNPAEAETLDSREVAEMVGKQHKHLLRDINGYIENMKQGTEPKVGLSAAELKIEPSEFSSPVLIPIAPVGNSLASSLPRRGVSSSPTSSPVRRGRSSLPCM